MASKSNEIMERLWDAYMLLCKDKDETNIATLIHKKFAEFCVDHNPVTWAHPMHKVTPASMNKTNVVSGLSRLPENLLDHFIETMLIQCAGPTKCELMGRIPPLYSLYDPRNAGTIMELRNEITRF
jgi:hypothetical protein